VAAGDSPVKAAAPIGRQRVRGPAVTQLHLQQVAGAVAQGGWRGFTRAAKLK